MKINLNVFWATERGHTMLVVGKTQVLAFYQLPMHSVFPLSPPSLPRRKGWGPYWAAQMLVACPGWSDWLMNSGVGVLRGRQESDSHLFSFSFCIRRHQFRTHRKLPHLSCSFFFPLRIFSLCNLLLGNRI